ncbi:right-handed parallel beta-helix repeat-containing protein, partial [Myxococcota bacterium]|nr:right-handed parallel beta-helix repeat-containing protein [Myxococcota bacterium]
DTSLTGVYTHGEANHVTVRFENNVFRGFHFNYPEVYPSTTEPVAVFGVGSNTENPHFLTDNTADAPYPFIMWIFDSVTETGNVIGEVPPVIFSDFMNTQIEGNFRLVEWWTPTATRHPDNPPVTYEPGDYVMHLGTLYRALTQNTGEAPDESPGAWEALPPPADDVTLAPESPHQGLGVR